MSRSYRKPYSTYGKDAPRNKQFWKKIANRKVRNSKEIFNGKSYKRLFDSWNIDDYSHFVPPSNIEKYWPEWWKLLRK